MSICPNCGSKHIEQHDASGASICTECGVVVEENAIVSSVEFVEGAGGASSMVGQFVSQTSARAYTAGRGGRYGFSRDSRETTLLNGRRRIQDVASRMRLGSHYVDAAHRLFTIAVEKNFVQGRRTTHVVAACLYISCRQEKSQHMLIDFSDALQVNVYTLGTCFLKFRRLLGLKLEIIDPALYVYRFAAHLELLDKANAVALTALRLVGRMKRDWIVLGRRPAGICAAALLIAARAHGFSRHHQDVTRILRVCGLTVHTRVKEFEKTPSAALTLEQFHTVEIEHEVDPPAFTKNRIREARARAIQQKNYDLLTSGALDDPLDGKNPARWRKAGRKQKLQTAHDELYKELEQQLNPSDDGQKQEAGDELEKDSSKVQQTQGTSGKQKLQTAHDELYKELEQQLNPTDDGQKQEAGDELEKDSSKVHGTSDQTIASFINNPEENQIVTKADGSNSLEDPRIARMYPKSKYGQAIVLPNQATAEELQASKQPTEDSLDLAAWKDEMPEKDAEEIESIFRTDEEIAHKEAIFNSLNKDYLVQQERKESERAKEEETAQDKQDDELAQAEGHARYVKSKTGRKRRKDGPEGETQTTEEALLAAVSTRKISRKINYDAMSSLFGEDGGFSTEGIESNEPTHDELHYAMV